MRVLITAASRHGATSEIARHTANTIEARGIETVVANPDEVGDLSGYQAVVLGSAVYAGHWMPEAKNLAKHSSLSVAWMSGCSPAAGWVTPTCPTSTWWRSPISPC